ncbi:MAG: NAD(P)H-quinone oxidoreductase [Acidiferrobacterales bacterium]
MQAVEIKEPGGPEVLVIGTREIPVPGIGEVLVQVTAAGINRPDVLQRRGLYPPPPGVSAVPGLEVAGIIAALGQGVTEWRLNDRVCALLAGGGYAEYCVVPATQCLPIPRGLDAIEAASLPETFFTVWSNVFDRAGIRQGESLLVQGGASGIGVAAIQIASAFGHRVFATAGSAEKCAACERLGAERAINYKTEDFGQAVKAITRGLGVDVILDMVGGDYVMRELRVLADDGRLIVIAYQGGRQATVDLDEIMRRRLTLTGSTLRARPAEFKAAIARSLRMKVWPLLETGRVRAVVHATFPLEQAAQAHALLESGDHFGKIVLTVGAD